MQDLATRPSVIQSAAFKISESVPYYLLRPEYFLRPSQMVRRAWGMASKDEPKREVTLPWGAQMVVDPSEHIGGIVYRTGVYDLVVLETIIRLADRGELALDVGANIGLMSSALAAAVGPTGRVLSFEPHPRVVEKLRHHVDRWRQGMGWDHVTVHPVALSDDDGTASLVAPDDFAENQGKASLEDYYQGESITIQTRKLDGILSEDDSVGVMKIDVEGHEHKALAGAHTMMTSGRIRDIIFEEYFYPGPAVQLMEEHGYTIFGLKKTMFGPQLIPALQLVEERTRDIEPPNFIATIDPQRARERFAHIGWRALRRLGKR